MGHCGGLPVWVNGHYLGTEQSGCSSFARNISEILNYGGDNAVTARVDASLTANSVIASP
jgi:beta-galactosidase